MSPLGVRAALEPSPPSMSSPRGLLRGESPTAPSRDFGVEVYRHERRRERVLTRLRSLARQTESASPSRPSSTPPRLAGHRRAPHGDLALTRADRSCGPVGQSQWKAMSAANSVSRAVAHGVKRACAAAWPVACTAPMAPAAAVQVQRGAALALLDEEYSRSTEGMAR